MTFLRNGLLAAAAVGALSLGFAGNANATAYSLSVTTVRNLLLSADPAKAFGLTFDFDASTTANLTGFATVGDTDDADAPFSCALDGTACSSAEGPINPLQAFLGNPLSNPGQNSFAAVGSANPNFARADHFLTDTVINTAAGVPTGGGGDWQSIAEGAVAGNAFGGSNIGENTQFWNFSSTFAVDTDITIEFDIDLTLLAELSADAEAPPTAAKSNFDLSFTFLDQAASGGPGDVLIGDLLAEIVADSPGESVTRTEANLSILGVDQSGGVIICSPSVSGLAGFRHYSCSFTLLAGTYNFLIGTNNRVTQESFTSAVPEPATLGLLGAGLLGLGAIARRRKAA
jgi:hypothetical protein